jgi:hypothetical protein
MSGQFNRNRGQQQQQVMECKVCKDAGLDRGVYTSHRVKDQAGNVICPTLLKQECRYCFTPGHTVKFCPEVKERERLFAKSRREEDRADAYTARKIAEKKRAEEEKKAPAKSKGGAFASLSWSDSDDDDDPKQKKIIKTSSKTVVKEEFPALQSASASVSTPSGKSAAGTMSWASVCATVPATPEYKQPTPQPTKSYECEIEEDDLRAGCREVAQSGVHCRRIGELRKVETYEEDAFPLPGWGNKAVVSLCAWDDAPSVPRAAPSVPRAAQVGERVKATKCCWADEDSDEE